MKRIDQETLDSRKKRRMAVKELQQLVGRAFIKKPRKGARKRYMNIRLLKTSIAVTENMVSYFEGNGVITEWIVIMIQNGINRTLKKRGYEIDDFHINDGILPAPCYVIKLILRKLK